MVASVAPERRRYRYLEFLAGLLKYDGHGDFRRQEAPFILPRVSYAQLYLWLHYAFKIEKSEQT